MAIKKLQNDYTTPEQSRRLLELGVPADSANMWWEKDETILINGEWVHGAAWGKVPIPFNWDRENNRFYTYSEIKGTVEDFTGNDTLPCWSSGRLMEIFEICNNLPKETRMDICCIPSLKRMSYIEYMMKCYNKAIEYGMLDFSKLEE